MCMGPTHLTLFLIALKQWLDRTVEWFDNDGYGANWMPVI